MVFEKAHRRGRRRRRIVAAASAGFVTIGLGLTALLGGFGLGPSIQSTQSFQVVSGVIRPTVTSFELSEYVTHHHLVGNFDDGAFGGKFNFYVTQTQALQLAGTLRSSGLFTAITVKSVKALPVGVS